MPRGARVGVARGGSGDWGDCSTSTLTRGDKPAQTPQRSAPAGLVALVQCGQRQPPRPPTPRPELLLPLLLLLEPAVTVVEMVGRARGAATAEEAEAAPAPALGLGAAVILAPEEAVPPLLEGCAEADDEEAVLAFTKVDADGEAESVGLTTGFGGFAATAGG